MSEARTAVAEVAAELRRLVSADSPWRLSVAVNLVLAVAYEFIDRVSLGSHLALAVVSYVLAFVLADSTTTNMLGTDLTRVTASLGQGRSLGRILLVKDAALIVLVGLPALALTAAIALVSGEAVLPSVAGLAALLLTWLGIGNLASVAHPVARRSLAQRWRARRDRLETLRWLIAVAIPYVPGLLLSDPIELLPTSLTTSLHAMTRAETNWLVALALLAAVGLFGAATAGAVRLAARRPRSVLQAAIASR